MKNLTLLCVAFILLDRIGLLFNVVVMNPANATPPHSIEELIEAFLFMLIFAFSYWIALYAGWIGVNILLIFLFRHSIIRSILAGASLPIAYLFFDTTWFLTAFHLMMGSVFGFLTHRLVDISQQADVS